MLVHQRVNPLMVSSCAPSLLSSDPAMRGIQRFWLSRGHLVGGRSGEDQGHGSMGIMIIIPWNLGLPYFQTNQHYIVYVYIYIYIIYTNIYIYILYTLIYIYIYIHNIYIYIHIAAYMYAHMSVELLVYLSG